MESLLSLPVGAAIQVLAFLVLYRFTPLGAKQAAVVVGALALALVLPYSLLYWPGGDVLAMHLAVYGVTAYVLAIIAQARAQRLQGEPAQGERWFQWGPALIVLFFIAVVLLNAVMVVLSKEGLPESLSHLLLPQPAREGQVSSAFPGTVARDLQKKEALYNAYLEQVRRQEDRGWQVRKGWLTPPVAGVATEFQVSVTDRDGAPVVGAEVSGRFLRPSDNRLDQGFRLRERDSGLYRAAVTLPQPGRWNLWLRIQRGEDIHELEASTRIQRPAPVVSPGDPG
jgi:nitrogen fixation protein FixH